MCNETGPGCERQWMTRTIKEPTNDEAPTFPHAKASHKERKKCKSTKMSVEKESKSKKTFVQSGVGRRLGPWYFRQNFSHREISAVGTGHVQCVVNGQYGVCFDVSVSFLHLHLSEHWCKNYSLEQMCAEKEKNAKCDTRRRCNMVLLLAFCFPHPPAATCNHSHIEEFETEKIMENAKVTIGVWLQWLQWVDEKARWNRLSKSDSISILTNTPTMYVATVAYFVCWIEIRFRWCGNEWHAGLLCRHEN